MQYRQTKHQVARGTRPDEETFDRFLLIKRASTLRATYQIRLLASSAVQKGKKLVIEIPVKAAADGCDALVRSGVGAFGPGAGWRPLTRRFSPAAILSATGDQAFGSGRGGGGLGWFGLGRAASLGATAAFTCPLAAVPGFRRSGGQTGGASCP